MTPDEKSAQWASRIKGGMSRDALAALKERFNFYAPAFVFQQDFASAPVPGQDAKMITLNAAVRDGQREVLMYLERLLNHE